MNFLAHLYLSGTDEELLIGNFIADGVRGKEWEKYSAGIKNGIIVHRSIDTYTDTHPVVDESKDRLRPTYHKYSSVIVDIFYDHYLATAWAQYHHVPLLEYTSWVYSLFLKYLDQMPERMQHMLPYLIKENWLYDYSTTTGIDRALKGMARRASFYSGMDLASKDLEKYYGEFQGEFERFFPDLQQHVKAVIEKGAVPDNDEDYH